MSETDRKRGLVKMRVAQAKEAVADEGLFSIDQIAALHEAFDLIEVGIKESI